ncbi:MAG: D-sedoheptulose 7-phosphate isomerase [Desulfovibrio sp.]|jgi:D-sedoheptulose 7-phosphate isomerase|nr:D-sedoheptulose 7-phosphate isomerase [Desulfovibrio sp.]
MQDTAVTTILEHAEAGAQLRRHFFQSEARNLADIALRLALVLARGHKILLCGNGGSAADCQHLAAEFVNRFLMDRPPLPAIALTTDTSILTAVVNDFGPEQIFARQVQALGVPGDALLALSTSGRSPNVLAALAAARELSLTTCGLSGAGGGDMAPLCDFLLAVPDTRTPLIQEIHIAAGHLLCGLADYYLFENVSVLAPYLGKSQEPHDPE